MRTSACSIALSLLVLAGCGNDAPPVDWGGKYSATVQKRLDENIAKKDCDALQAELATARAIDEAKKRLYGSGSADLVAYIEWGLDKADCSQPGD
ncbi:MAG TPA: hypothetical protein VJL80_04390 [Aeromicrobium sp.]|jgi:hypothetical protein|nr:hypothetical protein [Aeromicrobium sp.]HKY57256.1 hypothetical protein [Aeromicrobium sp.]